MISQVKNEIDIMYQIDHENIIKLYNHFEDDEYLFLLIEFAEGGTNLKKASSTKSSCKKPNSTKIQLKIIFLI